MTNYFCLLAVPYFTTALPNTSYVTVTETVVLECEVIGSSPPNITWYRDTHTVQSGDRVDVEVLVTGNMARSRLQIHSVHMWDRSVYTCQAEDSEGINSTDTLLYVRCKFIPLSLHEYLNILYYNISPSQYHSATSVSTCIPIWNS